MEVNFSIAQKLLIYRISSVELNVKICFGTLAESRDFDILTLTYPYLSSRMLLTPRDVLFLLALPHFHV